MGQENRTVTLVDWPGTTTPGATPPVLDDPRAADVNQWQDEGIRGMLLDQTLTMSGWEGSLYVYAQRADITDGTSFGLTLVNPHAIGLPVELDLRNRILYSEIWIETTAAELPKGANYDADTFHAATTPQWNVWWTDDGAAPNAPPNPPTGIYWEPFTAFYVYAAQNATSKLWSDLDLCNHFGVDLSVVITNWIFERDTP